MSITLSDNMSLPIPGVGSEAGPDWATDLNNCLALIDSHTHANGAGVLITPSGINLNADLPFNGYSATTLLKTSFSSQSAALTGTNFASVVGGNLYFNDGSGNQIPITSGGGVAGSPGSIGSLSAPAAVTYSAGSKLFTFTADALKSAALDNGAVTIRETNVASAKGITLASPSSLSADYQLTFPAAVPASTQYLTSTSAGVLSFSTANTIAAAMTVVGADSIASVMDATGSNAIAAVATRATGTTVAQGGVAISNSCNAFSTASTSEVAVTNLSVTLTTSGRPVDIRLMPDATAGNFGTIICEKLTAASTNLSSVQMFIKRDGTIIAQSKLSIEMFQNTNGTFLVEVPAGVLHTIDAVAAGVHTYILSVLSGNGATQIEVNYCKLVAYEIGA